MPHPCGHLHEAFEEEVGEGEVFEGAREADRGGGEGGAEGGGGGGVVREEGLVQLRDDLGGGGGGGKGSAGCRGMEYAIYLGHSAVVLRELASGELLQDLVHRAQAPSERKVDRRARAGRRVSSMHVFGDHMRQVRDEI